MRTWAFSNFNNFNVRNAKHKLPGYMLFGNRSMILNTGGSVAWLYHFPNIFSPLRVLDSFFDRIPSLLERTTKFVAPVTRQTYESSPEISFLVDYTNVFHLDLEKDNSSFQFFFWSHAFNKFLLLKPTELVQITQFPIFGTKRAGIFTPEQIKSFWDNIIHASASGTALKKLTRTILPIWHKPIQFENRILKT